MSIVSMLEMELNKPSDCVSNAPRDIGKSTTNYSINMRRKLKEPFRNSPTFPISANIVSNVDQTNMG